MQIGKRGKKGAPAHFITRSKALRKLQLGLPQFRRLCILKGIYPRVPPKTKKFPGNRTYFYVKDINFLAHDPLLQKFRDITTHKKKVKRAIGRRELNIAKRLHESTPTYRLDHIIRERYPTFLDALRDLDDTLCMLHLYALLPEGGKVKNSITQKCARLCKEFQNYVVETKSLRKVFLSIKGIYYQAEIMGVTITWITPYNFTQEIPKDVDYKVVESFLELYITLMGFVNFKLYTSLGAFYPPKIDEAKDGAGGGLSAIIIEKIGSNSTSEPKTALNSQKLNKLKEKMENIKEEKKIIVEEGVEEENYTEEKEVFHDTEKQFAQKEEQQKKSKHLFEGLVFFLNREVPISSLEFVIKSFGGRVSWDCEAAPYKESDPSITHHVADRESLLTTLISREYIQPQWVYDCVNAGVLLATHEYGLKSKLPPHLSPFVDNEREGYLPLRQEEIDALLQKKKAAAPEKKVQITEEEETDKMEEEYQQSLQKERKGISYSKAKEDQEMQSKDEDEEKSFVPSKKRKREALPEEKQLQLNMLTGKKKKLYQRMTKGMEKKQKERSKLMRKRLEAQKQEEVGTSGNSKSSQKPPQKKKQKLQ